jgi:PST family polysaccharide transporter
MPSSNSLSRKTFSGLLWLSSGALAAIVFRFPITVALSRLLAPGDFGLIAAAAIVLGVSDLLGSAGLGPALVRRSSLREEHLSIAFTVSWMLGVALSGATFVASPWLEAAFGLPGLGELLRVLCSISAIRSLSVVAESLLRRELRFKAIALTELAAYVLGYGAVAVPMAALGFGTTALVSGMIGEATLRTTILCLLRPHPSRPTGWSSARELARDGLGFTASQLFSYVALRVDNFIVGRLLGASALGLYTRAYGLMTLPVSLAGSILNRVLLGPLATLQTDPARLRNVFRRGVVLLSLILLPASALLMVLARETIAVLLGDKWLAASLPLAILAPAMYLRTGYKISGTLADATGHAHRNARLQLGYAVLVALGAVIGARAGTAGVAGGVAAAISVQFLLLSRLALGICGLGWREFALLHRRALVLAAAIALGSAAAASALRAGGAAPLFTLVAGSAAGLLAAAFSLLLNRTPSAEETWWLRAFGAWLGRTRPRLARSLGLAADDRVGGDLTE